MDHSTRRASSAPASLSLAALGRGTPNTVPPPAARRLSRAFGPVAVRGPARVALAAGLLVAGRARRHAAAGAAAREARPGAPVLARVLAAPHVAGAAAVCAHAGERTRKQKVSRELGDAKNEKHRGRREARACVPLAGSTIWCGGGPTGGAGG